MRAGEMTRRLRNAVIVTVTLVTALAADVWALPIATPDDQYWHQENQPQTTHAPVFKIKPGDKLASTGDDVIMDCSLLAEDDLTVNWRRGDGKPLPTGRYKILEDSSLLLKDLEDTDEAVYVCSASNTYGTSEASAKLTIHSPPRFVSRPRDKWATVGKHVKLRCSVTGNPQPSLFWSRKDRYELLIFQDQKQDRYSVDWEGNLRIGDARTEDSGAWQCNGLSTAGSVTASALLTVIHSDPNKTCKDWRGRTVFEGERYYPDQENLCYRCRCLNASATFCKTRVCHPPTEPCAIWQKVPQECCRFSCIKRHEDKTGGATYQTAQTPDKQDTDDGNSANALQYSLLATLLVCIMTKLMT